MEVIPDNKEDKTMEVIPDNKADRDREETAAPAQATDAEPGKEAPPEKPVDRSRRALEITKKLAKRWFIDAFLGMSQGLFCTLIAGTILAQIAGWILSADTAAGQNVGNFVNAVANVAKALTGAGIGVGIAHSLKAPRLVMFSAAVSGFAGGFADVIIVGTFQASFAPGNPIGSYIVALIATEIGMLIHGRTRVDIVVVPIGMMIISMLSIFVAYPFIIFINIIAEGIELATGIAPV